MRSIYVRPLRLLKANTKKRRPEILHVLPNEREKEKNSSINVWQSATADDVCQLTGLCMVTFRWRYARSLSTRGIWLGDDKKCTKDRLSKPLITKLLLKKKVNKSALASNWPQIPWNAKKTKSLMMYKIIHELVDLNIHNYLQFSKERRTRNSHAYKFQMPFVSKNSLKFSFFLRSSSEWNQLPAEVMLSPSLAMFKEKATTCLNNNSN